MQNKFFAVIYPDSPSWGWVLSRHRTEQAARRAIARELAAFRRRRPSDRNAWLEREIVPCEHGAARVRRG